MAIYAESTGGTKREPLEPGTYIGRCYQMLHIGTSLETIPGQQPKKMNKVRLGFELPEELKEGKDGNPGSPITLSKEFTLSMHEKSGLRKMLEGWRKKKFTDEEAKRFDITALLGLPCILNVIVNDKGYEDIASVTPPMKNQQIPGQHYATQELNYDEFNEELFNDLPDFLKEKIKKTDEYKVWIDKKQFGEDQRTPEYLSPVDDSEDLPF